jgi:CRISPR-associated protein Csb2
MPLSIMVHLLGGGYDAGGERPSEGEWPPHPARVFCALAASAQSESDWEVLRWLERQGPPQVWADRMDQVRRSRVHGYVVQNAIKHGGGNLNWPGRTNGSRARSSVVPSSDWFAIVWPDSDAPAEAANLLNLLAWKVPYVGRSTGRAQVSVTGSMPAESPGGAVYEPATTRAGGGSVDLRIPYPGYSEALRSAYAAGVRSWEVARACPYREAVRAGDGGLVETSAPTRGPFDELLVWTIERGRTAISGDRGVALAVGLRNAVISRVSDPVPGQISGHTEPGRPHAAFLVLPDVGHRHADGHVLGLALAVPRDLPQPELAVLLRALITEPGLTRVGYSGGNVLTVRYGADKAGLSSVKWSASHRGGEREWVSVTPVMLDGHTRRGRDEASEVARTLVIAGYPRPAKVEVSASPMVAGGVWRPRPETLPSNRPRRQMVHARVQFEGPVVGPVLAGSMRYLGLGLFQPATRDRARGLRRPDETPADRRGKDEARSGTGVSR